jgi:hypothetical protein
MDKSLQHLSIWTPIGAESVRIEGTEVVGRWQQSLRTFTGLRDRLLAEDFVNSSDDPEEIVRFTGLYGPLREEAKEGEEFRFSINEWRGVQSIFRQIWESRAGKTTLNTTLSGTQYDIFVRNRNFVFWAKSLEGFLLLELITATAQRLRKCQRPECPNPYFVARHLKQQYCSTLCAEWAQARSKKKWWEKKGTAWLGQRRKQRGKQSPKRATRRP